ncbi:hypothetical protein EMIT0P258_190022 [Pseudomonas sp. IT-P258]
MHCNVRLERPGATAVGLVAITALIYSLTA